MKNIIFAFALLIIMVARLSAQDLPTCPPGPNTTTIFLSPVHSNGDVVNPPPPPNDPPPDPPKENRGIFWVHGLGGNISSLSQVGAATDFGAPGKDFPARKTAGAYLNYPETGLDAAGGDLLTQMVLYHQALRDGKGVPDSSKNFIIAHSQGGMVARMAEKHLDDRPDYTRYHFGIVTIGTPHAGAQIVNSRNSGLINEFAKDACEVISKIEVNKLFEEFPFAGIFINRSNLNSFLDSLCGGGCSTCSTVCIKKIICRSL